jgi:AmmeMemoRadiSam system protein B
VAGQFYPADSNLLENTVDKLIGKPGGGKAVALIAPHAGYMYSGPVAGAVYSAVSVPANVVLIGPNHTGLGERASVMASGAWETPLGEASVNEELAALVVEGSSLFSQDEAAHAMEHSLEVQLPFILRLNPGATIVPITVMQADAAGCEEMGDAVAGAIGSFAGETLIVISSDMNHYEPDKLTREKDKAAIDRILKLDPVGLLDVAAKKGITMCGVVPAAIGLFAARRLGAREAFLVKYATSGDAGGDKSHVVGYAGIAIR